MTKRMMLMTMGILVCGSTAFGAGHEAVNVGDVLNQSLEEKSQNERDYRSHAEVSRPEDGVREHLAVDEDGKPVVRNQATNDAADGGN